MAKSVWILLCICFNIYAQEAIEATMQKENTVQTLLMSVAQHTFKFNLFENETTKAFIEKLPLSVEMNELNGNEKYFHFSTSYAYTKIGHIENTTHLEKALGKGNVVVTFELE